MPIKAFWNITPFQRLVKRISEKLISSNFRLRTVHEISQKTWICTNTNLKSYRLLATIVLL